MFHSSTANPDRIWAIMANNAPFNGESANRTQENTLRYMNIYAQATNQVASNTVAISPFVTSATPERFEFRIRPNQDGPADGGRTDAAVVTTIRLLDASGTVLGTSTYSTLDANGTWSQMVLACGCTGTPINTTASTGDVGTSAPPQNTDNTGTQQQPTGPSYNLQLAVMSGNHTGQAPDWGWGVERSAPIPVNGNGTFTATVNIESTPHITQLGIISEGLNFDSRGSAVAMPANWDDPKIVFNSVTFNGGSTNHAPEAGMEIDMREYNDAGATGFAAAILWNAFHSMDNVLTGVTNSTVMDWNDAAQEHQPRPDGIQAFTVPNAPITSVTVQFTVSGLDVIAVTTPNDPTTTASTPATTPAQPQIPDGFVIYLMARDATTWNNTSPYLSAPHVVTGDGTFEVTLNIPGGQPHFANLAFRSAGANFDHPNEFDNAVLPPAEWREGAARGEATIQVTGVTVNGSITVPVPGNAGGFLVERQGDHDASGYVDFALWNAWHAPSRRLQAPAVPRIHADNAPDNPSFGVEGADSITSITVRFIIADAGAAQQSESTQPPTTTGITEPPVTGGTGDQPTGTDTNQQSPGTTDTGGNQPTGTDTNQQSPGTNDTNQTSTPDYNFTQRMGDVNNDGVVDIQDALEILKYIAGIDNVLTSGPNAANNYHAARLTPESRVEGSKLGVTDALEVLKHLAGIQPNGVDNPVPPPFSA
jgi:hypothetical protein